MKDVLVPEFTEEEFDKDINSIQNGIFSVLQALQGINYHDLIDNIDTSVWNRPIVEIARRVNDVPVLTTAHGRIGFSLYDDAPEAILHLDGRFTGKIAGYFKGLECYSNGNTLLVGRLGFVMSLGAEELDVTVKRIGPVSVGVELSGELVFTFNGRAFVLPTNIEAFDASALEQWANVPPVVFEMIASALDDGSTKLRSSVAFQSHRQ